MSDTAAKKMLTPYGAAKLVNEALKEAGLDKRIPPQMMYNYTMGRVNKDKEPYIKYDTKNGVDRKDLARWIKAYVVKQETKVTEALQAEEAAEDETPETIEAEASEDTNEVVEAE